MKKELRETWKEVETHLLEARRLFDTPVTGVDGFSEERFNDYLSRNELGLALEELEGISLFNETPREFWQLLLKSANKMCLAKKSKEYMETLRHYQ
ncbi:MAG: hypothetical protein MI976_03840 [Pseudomonadales bacterium]|nr:hypothetical protein [Pseudomonadales bacterium]